MVEQLARPTILCGASLGGLVSLGVKARNLRAIVALDPPFRTAKLWRMLDRMRALDPATITPYERDLLANVFGVSPSGVEDRDYLGLLEGLRTPTLCIVGGIPLMPRRDLADDPSLVDEDEREVLRAHPMIEVRIAPGVGHNISGKAGPQVVAALRPAVASVRGAQPPV